MNFCRLIHYDSYNSRCLLKQTRVLLNADSSLEKCLSAESVFSRTAKNHMIITTRNGETFDTERDLTAPERHILQKLFLWESLASSLQEFREKKEEALKKGWNQSGPVKEGQVLSRVIEDLELRVTSRLGDG